MASRAPRRTRSPAAQAPGLHTPGREWRRLSNRVEASGAAAARPYAVGSRRGGPLAPDDIELRRSGPGDRLQVLGLLEASLRWVPNELYSAFFTWKHDDNPFGPSPAWVATVGDVVVGFRTLLRWEFEQGGQVLRAVRAVDTATHPDFQGRGIFSRLSMRAVEEMTDEGVDFVFNTPNDNSRPGYLKMGWIELTRVRVRARPRRWPAGLVKMATARAPADKWSIPSSVGLPAAEVCAATGAIDALLASQSAGPWLRTRRSARFLQWRYRFGPLAYRALLAGNAPDDGFAIFRLRRRGSAVETTVCDVLVPGGEPRAARRLLRRVAREAGGDYAVVVAQSALPGAGYVRVPRVGPVLTWRALARSEPPAADSLRLAMGDVELF